MIPIPPQGNSMNTSHTTPTTEHDRLDVGPLSLDVLETVLIQENLHYVRDEDMLHTGFINNSISLGISDGYLLARSHWRAFVPVDQAPSYWRTLTSGISLHCYRQ